MADRNRLTDLYMLVGDAPASLPPRAPRFDGFDPPSNDPEFYGAWQSPPSRLAQFGRQALDAANFWLGFYGRAPKALMRAPKPDFFYPGSPESLGNTLQRATDPEPRPPAAPFRTLPSGHPQTYPDTRYAPSIASPIRYGESLRQGPPWEDDLSNFGLEAAIGRAVPPEAETGAAGRERMFLPSDEYPRAGRVIDPVEFTDENIRRAVVPVVVPRLPWK